MPSSHKREPIETATSLRGAHSAPGTPRSAGNSPPRPTTARRRGNGASPRSSDCRHAPRGCSAHGPVPQAAVGTPHAAAASSRRSAARPPPREPAPAGAPRPKHDRLPPAPATSRAQVDPRLASEKLAPWWRRLGTALQQLSSGTASLVDLGRQQIVALLRLAGSHSVRKLRERLVRTVDPRTAAAASRRAPEATGEPGPDLEGRGMTTVTRPYCKQRRGAARRLPAKASRQHRAGSRSRSCRRSSHWPPACPTPG